jgi:C_GCAxxG_C_C family probable redox protein
MINKRRNFLKCFTSGCLAASVLPASAFGNEQDKAEANVQETKSKGEQALAMMGKYGSCCTGVLAAFAPELGMDEELAGRLGLGMAGGVGSQGNVCGAVSGATMVIGLKTLDAEKLKDRAAAMETIEEVKEFIAKFEEKHSSIICRELIGRDISTKEKKIQAMKENAYANCPGYVQSAAEIVDEMFSS